MLELKIDLHVHTNYSDSLSSVEEVLEAARRKKLDGVAITDHDTMMGVEEARDQAHGLLLIPGIEVGTVEGHLLILGVTKPPTKGLSAVEVAEYARTNGGVVIIAHPHVPFHSFNEEAIRRIRPDAIETYNAKTPFSKQMIRKNIDLAERLGLPQTGGSDSHMHQTVGDMYTLVTVASRRVEDVVEAIRRGRIRPAGHPSPLWERPIWSLHRVFHRLRLALTANTSGKP